jgi:hypothetical protein
VDGAKLYVYPPIGASLSSTALYVDVVAAADTSNAFSGAPISGVTFDTEDDFALEWVNGSTSLISVSIAQDGDIVLDFNKAFDPANATATPPVAAPTAVLYFTYGGYSAVTATSATPAAGSKSLKITPTNLLALPASGVTYAVYYQATSGGVKIAGNITVTVTAASNPTKSPASFSGLAINGTVSSSDSNFGVVYTPATVPPFTQNYAIKRIENVYGANNIWDPATQVGTYNVPKGSAAGTALAPVSNLSLPTGTPHTNAENVKVRLEGVSATGYAAASSAVPINFN